MHLGPAVLNFDQWSASSFDVRKPGLMSSTDGRTKRSSMTTKCMRALPAQLVHECTDRPGNRWALGTKLSTAGFLKTISSRGEIRNLFDELRNAQKRMPQCH